MDVLAHSLTVYVCPYCGAKHLDRYEARGSRCPHRGDYFEAVEMVPAATTRAAVAALRAAERELDGRDDFDPDQRVLVLRQVRAAIRGQSG